MPNVSQLAGAVAAGATSGPIAAVSTIIGGINDIIGKFVTDPNAKLEAQQHALDAMTKQAQAAAESAKTIITYGARGPFSAMGFPVYTCLSTPGLRANFCARRRSKSP